MPVEYIKTPYEWNKYTKMTFRFLIYVLYYLIYVLYALNWNPITNPDNNSPVCVWLDMDLYKRAVKLLQHLQPEFYSDKWIELSG